MEASVEGHSCFSVMVRAVFERVCRVHVFAPAVGSTAGVAHAVSTDGQVSWTTLPRDCGRSCLHEESKRCDGRSLMADNAPKVFVSYSHDSQEHKDWVLKLSTRLVANGVDIILDQWDLPLGGDLPRFMALGLTGADRVLAICT